LNKAISGTVILSMVLQTFAFGVSPAMANGPDELNVIAELSNGGIASAYPTSVLDGESSTITAEPNPGYYFEKWTGDECDATGISKNPYTLTNVTKDQKCEAKFKEQTTLKISDPTIPILSKIYDGNTSAEVIAGELSGIINKEDAIGVNAIANYDNKNVGTDKTIVVTYELTGIDAYKYNLLAEYIVYNGEITKKRLKSQLKIYRKSVVQLIQN